MQVACGAGGARAFDRAQAGAVQALRCRDECARHPARLRAQGGTHDAEALCRSHPQPRRRTRYARVDCAGAVVRARSSTARAQRLRQAGTHDGARRPKGQAIDVGTGRWADRGADLRVGDRRSKAVQIVEGGRSASGPDAEEVPVG